MQEHPEILAIDDDQNFVRDLKKYFSDRGIQIATMSDPILAHAIRFSQFKVILLDLDMPDISGQTVLKMIPPSPRPSVIVVSGLDDANTKLDILSQGADFFLSKPLNFNEALLICSRITSRNAISRTPELVWSLLRSNQSILSPSGAIFGLTTSEFRILELLIVASPDVVTKESLAKAIGGYAKMDASSFFRSIEVLISRMRNRCSTSDQILPIKALRNVGYIFYGKSLIDE